MERLHRETPCRLTERVLQFGEGNFLRGFVDWMFDRLNKENNGDFGVVVVQPINVGPVVGFLNEQDGLYDLYLRGLMDGEKVEENRVVECITRGINPYTDTDAFFDCALNPDLRYIVSNTTEAGIEYKSGQSGDDFENNTFPGRLAMFMKKRFDAGLPGFVILPCELIDKNGDALKECVLKYGDDFGYGGDFKAWVENENIFASTLVDRIVTGYPRDTAAEMEKRYGHLDNVINTAEIFHLWVIECDKSVAEELPFTDIGLNVIWTDDVTPYKKRKVRILNGAHTMSVLAARLAGLETVGEMMNDEDFMKYINIGLFDEIIPTLDLPKDELESFANAVIERFKNPFIKHYLLSIALNSVSKYKVRVLPSLLEYRNKFGSLPKVLTFGLAALIVFYKGTEANDDADVMEFMKNASVEEILANKSLWDEDLSFMADAVNGYVDEINATGMRAAVKELLK